jgi:hypothetical protein
MSTNRESADAPSHFVDARWALVGGGVSALTLFLIVLAVGRLSSLEGRRLLESSVPNVQLVASTVIVAGTTVLALMLALLGITYSTKWEFRETHYQRVKQIAFLTTVSIIGGVGLLLLTGFPLEEAEALTSYYNVMYGLVTGGASLLGGILIAAVLMLDKTIRGIIAIGQPSDESDLIEPGAGPA